MDKRVSVVQQIKGDAVANATVRVLIHGTQNLAVLYAANNTATQLPNPITTGANGTYEYYAANGRYDEEISVRGQVYGAISDIKLYDRTDDTTIGVTDASLATIAAYKRKSNDQFLSGRQRDLSAFNFASVYGNGVVYPAATIRSTYPTGIGTAGSGTEVLTRAVDQVVVGSTTSEVPSGDRAVWDLSLMPDHVVTIGRPRSQLLSQMLEFDTPYCLELSFKMKQPDVVGWNNRTAGMFESAMLVISQQDGDGDQSFSAGQKGDAASPLYIIQRGGIIYPDIRAIAEGLGLSPDDPDGGAYVKWSDGDAVSISSYYEESRSLAGHRYHDITIFFMLSADRRKDGGKGYFRAYFDGRPWFHITGTTCAPKNAAGNLIPCHARVGFYETVTSPGTLANGTLVSTIGPTSIARTMRIRHFTITKVGK